MKAKLIVSILILSLLAIAGCSRLQPGPQAQPDGKQGKQSGQNSSGDSGSQDAAQNGGQTGTDIEEQGAIRKFRDLDEVKDFLAASADVTGIYNYARTMAPLGLGGTEEMDVVSEAAPLPDLKVPYASNQAADDGGSADYSETNVQVEGVDEADIVKTDGKHIYAVVKNSLFIIDAYPPEAAEVLAKVEFKNRPQDIYVQDDRLVIYGQDYSVFEMDWASGFRRRNNFTYLKVFDISDRRNPEQVRDIDFEGNYSDSRLIGDYLYFVTDNYNYYYIQDEPVLPRIVDNGQVLDQACGPGARCLAPDIYYFDIPYSSYNFTSVAAVNIMNDREPIASDVYLMSANQNIYVSPDNLYITFTKHLSEYQLEMMVMREFLYPRLSSGDQDKIAKIEAVQNFILSPEEKQAKVGQIISRYIMSLSEEEQENLQDELEEKMKAKYEDISKELEKTVIHRVSIRGSDIDYQASGEVTGHVLNQFSMDQAEGYFRIATTKGRTWSRYEERSRESYSNVYVLDMDLEVVGSLENLAPDERIYSARFMQDRVYLVTFKQIDPLFVIDLSVPANPKVLGELKIPGYSDYLHPYDDTTLIGFGKDAKASEWGGVTTGGLKLSLFDVSDVSAPKEVDTYIMGDRGSDSIALRDHKAWLFSRDKNLLAIPVSIREVIDERSWGKLTFSGAAVFRVDQNGFEMKGRIDHSDGGQASDDDFWRGYNYYDNTVKRCLYIDDVLYTFSNKYLAMNEIGDLDEIKRLEIKKARSGQDDDFDVIN